MSLNSTLSVSDFLHVHEQPFDTTNILAQRKLHCNFIFLVYRLIEIIETDLLRALQDQFIEDHEVDVVEMQLLKAYHAEYSQQFKDRPAMPGHFRDAYFVHLIGTGGFKTAQAK